MRLSPPGLLFVPSLLLATCFTGGTAGAADKVLLQVTRVEERPATNHTEASLLLMLDDRSRALFATWTRKHVGQGVQLLVDGDVLVEARLVTPITEGKIVLQSGAGQRQGAIQAVLSHNKGAVTASALP
jgi:hypothetical protein